MPGIVRRPVQRGFVLRFYKRPSRWYAPGHHRRRLRGVAAEEDGVDPGHSSNGGGGPIPFEGLDSTNPLAVQGLRAGSARPRQADGGPPPDRRLPVALVRLGRSRHVRDRHARPAVARSGRRPDAGRPPEDGRRVRVHREARRALLLLPRSGRRPGGASFAEFRDNLDALADDALGYQERTGAQLLWGTANLFTHPRYQGGASTNPDPEVFAYAAAQVKHMLEVTAAAGRHELRPVGRPRGLRHAAQHRPPARGRPARPVPSPRRRAQAPDRLRGHAAHRAQADGADEAPVRLRLGDDPRLPRPQRAGGRVPAQHRGEPRDARRPLVPPRGRVRGRARHPRLDRREPRRPPERLGHRPVPELRRGPGPAAVRDPQGRRVRPAASTSTRSCAARAPTGPTCSRPTSAASTRWPGRCSSPPTCSSARRCPIARDALRRLGGPLGTAILDGRESLASLEAKVASGEIDPQPVSGRQELLENLVNQAIWTATMSTG